MGRQVEWKIVWRGGWAYLSGTHKGQRIRRSLKTRDPDVAMQRYETASAPYRTRQAIEAERLIMHRIVDTYEDQERAENHDREVLRIDAAATWYNDHPEERPQAAANTLQDYRYQWNKFAQWIAGNRPGIELLRDVRGKDAIAFAKWLKRTSRLSGNRYKKILATCKRYFKYIMAHQPQNPFRRMEAIAKNTRAQPESRRPFTPAELSTVFKHAKGEQLIYIALGYYTSMRAGDCATLLRTDVDFELNRIHRIANKTRHRSGKVVAIEIHDELRSILGAQLAKHESKYVLPGLADQYSRNPSKISGDLTRFLEHTCDIRTTEMRPDGKRPIKRIDFHSFRHTWATEAARRGADQATLQAVLGHGSPIMQKFYVHVGPDAIRAAVQSVPAVTEQQLDGDPVARFLEQALTMVDPDDKDTMIRQALQAYLNSE